MEAFLEYNDVQAEIKGTMVKTLSNLFEFSNYFLETMKHPTLLYVSGSREAKDDRPEHYLQEQ